MRGTVSKECFDMHMFTDVNWAGDILTRRSTTGYIVFASGEPIARQSKLRTAVSTSSRQQIADMDQEPDSRHIHQVPNRSRLGGLSRA